MLLAVVLCAVSLAAPGKPGKASAPQMSVDQVLQMAEPTFDVDLVYTWVNGSDPTWMNLRSTFAKPLSAARDANSAYRFRSHDELRYSLRSVAQYAPWVRNIYVVTCCGQKMTWLKEGDKVKIVDHAQIFPSRVYDPPTFNSFAIETWVHRIPNLAEQFVLMNDDFFFGAPVRKSDLFDAQGRPRVAFQKDWGVSTVPSPGHDDAYLWAAHNCDVLLDTIFTAEARYKILHQAYPVTKSLYSRAHDLYSQQLLDTTRHRYRERSDVIPHFLANWIGIYENSAVRLKEPDFPSNMYIKLSDNADNNKERLLRILAKSGEYKLFCIGDHMTNNAVAETTSGYVHDFFLAYFTAKSPWETD